MKIVYSPGASAVVKQDIDNDSQLCTLAGLRIRLWFALIAVAGFIFSSPPAEAVECEQLEAIACASSTDCMYKKAAGKFAYDCVAASNRCQAGFVQLSDDPKMHCETREGCSFVPAGKCYCPPDVLCICGGGTPPSCEISINAKLNFPVGHYIIVTARNASDVATDASSINPAESAIGETISFSLDGIKMPGLGCDSWEITEQQGQVVNLNDPMLADINIAPADSPLSAGDQRIMKSYAYHCEGEPFLNILHVDDRVIVIPWANSSKYLVAEKPLSTEQIAQLQKQLKSMKFYQGEITGVIDEPTRFAIKSWAEYRANSKDDYSFYRAAITENLLDTLGVLGPRKSNQLIDR